VDGFGELPLEEPQGFSAAVPGGESALVVVAAGAGEDRLDVRGEVDRVVQSAVAATGQAVANDVAAGRFDWGGGGVAREVVGAGKPLDVTDVAEILAASTSLIPVI